MKNTCIEETITQIAFEGFENLDLSYRINTGKPIVNIQLLIVHDHHGFWMGGNTNG